MLIVQIIKLKYIGDKVKGKIENRSMDLLDQESIADFVESMTSDLEDGYVLTYTLK